MRREEKTERATRMEGRHTEQLQEKQKKTRASAEYAKKIDVF